MSKCFLNENQSRKVGFTDSHSHILPGMDDGSSSLEMSVAMLQKSWEQGVTTMIATPHFYAHNDSPEAFLARRKDTVEQLQAQMVGMEQVPELKMGAEVYYFPNISDAESLPELAIDGKKYILIEMPMHGWTDGMYRELEDIYMKQGLVPVIAHIDRYIGPFHYRKIMSRLLSLPVLIQASSAFFLRKQTRSLALRMLKEQRIHLLGSDCHDMTLRPPNLRQAIDLILEKNGKNAMEHISAWEQEILCEEQVGLF